MSDFEVRNATIEYTHLGVACSDHGILSFTIGLNYGGSGQGYGQICLDTYDDIKKKRAATPLATSLLLAVDEVWGVDWEKLIGLPCRAYSSWDHIAAVGHYLEDKWMWFDKNTMEFRVTRFSEVSIA